jgi:xanthine dehydrogenase accessory factor
MMRMLVRADGSQAGTVGGGRLEAEVREAALASLRDERPRTLAFSLNERDYPDSGLLCGGQVEIFVEPITEPRLVLFGGGHVSKAIARAARTVGFHVTVADERPDHASDRAHPDAHEFRSGPYGQLAAGLAGIPEPYVVVATPGHEQDREVLQALFEAGVRPRYLGMIGSQAKRAQVEGKLRAAGVSEAFLGLLRTPMGLSIGARSHEEIAISVVAEMIAVRRLGAGPPPSQAGPAAR